MGAWGTAERQATREAGFGRRRKRARLPLTVLNDPATSAHLQSLAAMRNACLVRPRWPGAFPRYWHAVEQSPLRRHLPWSELDDLVSMSDSEPSSRAQDGALGGRARAQAA
jgi:hypothetical protein